jgi:hypothetical protein
VIRGLTIGEADELILSNSGERAILWAREVVELWDIREGRLLKRLPLTSRPKWAGFTVGNTAIALVDELGVYSFFDLDGAPLQLPDSVGRDVQLYYDSDCQRVNVWDRSGQVRQYTKGRAYFVWFRPSKKCE